MWEVEFTDEFGVWWDGLDEAERAAIDAGVSLLEMFGPALGRPHGDSLKGSRHSNMKELRTQHRGRPIRTFFAFDPRRTAILLIGGGKNGGERVYQRMRPGVAPLYDEYPNENERERLI